jgi:hypothetical protein
VRELLDPDQSSATEQPTAEQPSPDQPSPDQQIDEQLAERHQDELHQDELHQDELHQDALHQDELHLATQTEADESIELPQRITSDRSGSSAEDCRREPIEMDQAKASRE